MKTIKEYCLFILVMIGTLISCEEDNTIIDSENALIPLEVGNEWIYQNTRYTTPNKIDTISQIIGSKTEINGFVGYSFESGDKPYNSNFLVANNTEGDFINIGGFSDVDTLIVNSINFKYIVEKGDTWNYNSAILSYDEGTFEERTIEITCLANDTIIESAQGEIRCKLYEYSPNSGEDIFRYFIADNIGIIRSEHYELEKLFNLRELLEYNLN